MRETVAMMRIARAKDDENDLQVGTEREVARIDLGAVTEAKKAETKRIKSPRDGTPMEEKIED
jgi:hypothetical protein